MPHPDSDTTPQATPTPGQIVILNGTPRAGKSSIVACVQNQFDGVWMNLGVDRFKEMTPDRYQPGIGLRPGGERPDLEPLVAVLYRGMYEAIAYHARLGVNVVVDVGHHDAYSVPRRILRSSARQLEGLTVLLVGVRCPINVVMERRRVTWNAGYAEDGSVPAPVQRWQHEVHQPGIYDLEVDTSVHTAEQCAELIRHRLTTGPPPDALRRIGATAST